MANKVEYGISNLVFWELTADGTDEAVPTYGTEAYRVPGVNKVTVEYDSETSEYYGDNKKYWVASSNAGNSGTLSAPLLPDELKAKAFGWRIDANGGLVEDNDGKPARFAMAYQVEGDEANRRVVHYDVTLSIPNDEHNTTEKSITVDAVEVSWQGVPQNVKGETAARYSLPMSAKGKAAYDAWFSAPAVPAAKAAE